MIDIVVQAEAIWQYKHVGPRLREDDMIDIVQADKSIEYEIALAPYIQMPPETARLVTFAVLNWLVWQLQSHGAPLIFAAALRDERKKT